MISTELRKKFFDFFEKRGHKIALSSSLLPSDPTVLFTTAGMQQFSLYLAGEKDVIKDFGTRYLTSNQKCFRSDDIEEIGDDTHNTFFEMLGSWSIGQDKAGHYFKEGAIKYALEFLTDELGIDKNHLSPTIFKGNKDIPRDDESEKIWQRQGIPKERIKEFGEDDNLWGPVGEHGVCGPNSEIFYDRGEKFGCGKEDCGPNCSHCQRFVEIWNLVFIEYYKRKSQITNYKSQTNHKSQITNNKKFEFEYVALPQKSVDTGMGFERVLAILQSKPSVFETDLFFPIIQEIDKKTSGSYIVNPKPYRIIADHIRGICFLVAEGILPSNIEQGYILRRLLRRAIRFGKILNLPSGFLIPLAQKVIAIYKDVEPKIQSKRGDVLTVIQKEEEKFEKTLEKGLKEFEKLINLKIKNEELKIIDGEEAFELYQSYGFPLELTKELAKEKGFKIDEKGFRRAEREHREVSRKGAEKKFGGHGIPVSVNLQSPSSKIVKLHTATHLLHAALREILGNNVKQMGSDINEERLRFDFSFNRKMTEEELKKTEDLVNQKIKEDLDVKKEEMSYNKAIESGALSFFKEKYPEKVFVYSIGPSVGSLRLRSGQAGQVFSREICAGPHAKRTGELGRFKITKEQSSSAGVRRIKATRK